MSNRPRILIAEPESFSGEAVRELSSAAEVDLKGISQVDMSEALASYDVVWIRLHLQVREADIPAAMKCKYIVTATTGTDHIDVGALADRNCECISLRGHNEFLETVTSTSELAMGLLIALVRRIPAASTSVREGRWDRDRFRGRELRGMCLGLVGYGRLGRAMAKYAAVFGMRVLWYDPCVAEDDFERREDMTSLLSEADIVSVHVKLNEETKGMCDASFFSSMRSGSFFINTSRGAVVEERALLAALTEGHICGAALDVLCGEPAIDSTHALVDYAARNDNLLITPHIGGASADAMRRCEEHLAGFIVHAIREREA